MAARNYELKRGVLLEAFGDASKTCTNDTLTDELAEWYLKNYPDKIIYFARVPKESPARVTVPPPGIEIIEPKPFNPVEVLNQTVNMVKPEVKTEKKQRKTRK